MIYYLGNVEGNHCDSNVIYVFDYIIIITTIYSVI